MTSRPSAGHVALDARVGEHEDGSVVSTLSPRSISVPRPYGFAVKPRSTVQYAPLWMKYLKSNSA
jgi:hypothetical protein